MAGKEDEVTIEQNLLFWINMEMQKKIVKIWNLQLHDKTSYTMNNRFEKCSFVNKVGRTSPEQLY